MNALASGVRGTPPGPASPLADSLSNEKTLFARRAKRVSGSWEHLVMELVEGPVLELAPEKEAEIGTSPLGESRCRAAALDR